MRQLLCVVIVALAGCASSASVAPALQPRQVKIDGSNIEAVQNAGYKLVDKEGDKLYCRTDKVTGSRLETRTVCLTEQELNDQMNATRAGIQQIQQRTPANTMQNR